ncbi:extracellular catalytic domain type 1 short-chain-length polyhydroxyalkanoate depolymerase [Xaviernesmea oryzae]|nr:PHB depolymerase family esterase [Xaviernesmea oryzae]
MLDSLKPDLPPEVTAPKASRLQEIPDFGSNPGRLKMLAFIPDDLKPGAALVVVLHGCQQDAALYDLCSGWSHLARDHGFAVLYAEQQGSNNPNLCFNWFRPSNVARDRGEVMSIRQMIAHMEQTLAIDPKRIFITGLSAGGAMTASMLAAYPELFQAGGIIAGLAHGAARDAHRAFAAMEQAPARSPQEWGDLVREAAPKPAAYPRISIWQGMADRTVHKSNADALAAQWLDVHGLIGTNPRESQIEGHRRLAYADKDGQTAVEMILLADFDHGVPLKPTRGGERTGPFMLDAGLSSTRRLAREWGLM